MSGVILTRAQREVLAVLDRKDLQAIRKNPNMVTGAKHLAVACRKIIRKLESQPKYASRKKRETLNARIIKIAQRALEKSGT
jgi:hypothetical protein